MPLLQATRLRRFLGGLVSTQHAHIARQRLLLSLLGTLSLLAVNPARAIGFTGTFDPSSWLVINTNPDQTLNDTGTGTGISGFYTCGDTNDVACVENITVDSVDVVGSVYGNNITGGGTAGTTRSTSLVLTNNTDLNYYISFDWSFGASTAGGVSQPRTASYKVGNDAAVTFATWISGNILAGTQANIRVAPYQSVQFIVTTSNNTGAEPVLSMSSFNAAVPAPLPAAGAATAFGYSRRLRRRIKGKVPSKLKQSRTPSYPGAYLNLPPLALQAIPLTFNYQARSVGRFSMVASASSSSGFTSH